MEDNVLLISIRNRVPTIENGSYIVADNSSYKIKFDFDADWGYKAVKTARFVVDTWRCEVPFTGDTVSVPLLPSNVGSLLVGLYSSSVSTSSVVEIPVYDSVLGYGGGARTLDEAAELARVQSEAARADAETAREDAETSRAASEAARESAETSRKDAEAQRVSAEETRISQEQGRVSAESLRVSAENARAQKEQTRISAENARIDAENARIQAETNRGEAERSRRSSEAVRVQNENERIQAELLRASAESGRESAEAVRQANEQQRVQNELGRIEAESLRVQAETGREETINALSASMNALLSINDVVFVTTLLKEYGFSEAFRLYAEASAPSIGLTETALNFFRAAAKGDSSVYASSFYLYGTSPSTVGTKADANAGLVCQPSTNASAGRDDYADLPLFACFDCNYTIDGETLEPVIHAIKDVYGDYSSAPADSFVGVMQMSGWVRRRISSTSKIVEYAASCVENDFKPLPESVRASDNSIRPFVIHAKYAAGYNSAGKLSSISGVLPATGRPGETGISHDSQIALWRQWGEQYGGSSICDIMFLQLMLEIKYAVLGNAQVLSGCRDYNYNTDKAAVSESGVSRVLLLPSQAEKYVVGSCISLGTSVARNAQTCYAVSNIVPIKSKQSVTVDSVEYTALNLDTASTFDTVAGSTCVVTHNWRTGATDAVQGNDGSPTDNLSGKEPFKLQGIEVMLGICETPGDTTAYLRGNSSNEYVLYSNRRASGVRAGSFGEFTVLIGTGAVTGSGFVSELNWAVNDPEKYIAAQQFNATNTTGYRTKFRIASSSSGQKGFRAFGTLSEKYSGLVFAEMLYAASAPVWDTGTRACGTASNRGVYTPPSA